ncbi:MAG: PQQ-binding-like beta-propeller repeat protein, partial [Planctomycetota bacterium]|nr:PQQ-binding-like beta-propeller repeat protein [Planctomycetota bacterium]
LTFNVTNIMMEGARRLDEWALINQTIPRRTEIVRLIHPADEVARYEYGLPQDDVFAVVKLINARRPVEAIIQESGLGNFRTCKTLKAVIDEGHAELIPTSDLVRIASSFMSAGRLEEGIEAYRAAIARTPDDIDLRLQLAESALDRGETDVAADEYRAVGEICEGAGEKRKALESYTTAVELRRSDLETHERLFALYRELRERHLALEEGRIVARLHVERKQIPRAEEILLELLDEYPGDVVLMELLIKIYLGRKEKVKAIEQLEMLAMACESKRQYGKAEEAYQTILRLDRSRKDIERKAEEIGHRLRRGKKPKRGLKGVFVLIVLGIIGFGGWKGFEFFQRLQEASQAVETIRRYVAALPPVTEIQEDKEDIQSAISDGEELLREAARARVEYGPDHADLNRIHELLAHRQDRLRDRLRGIQEKIKADNEKLLLRALQLKNDEKLREARKVALAVIAAGEENNYPSRFKDAQDLIEEIERVQKDATELEILGKDAEASEDYGEAYRNFAELIRKYPRSEGAKSVNFPLRIQTEPPGVAVTQRGSSLGETPVLMHYLPGEEWTITLSKRGYEDLVVERRQIAIADLEAARITLKLVKTFEWFVDLGPKTKVKTDLVSAAGRVVVSTGDARVLVLDPRAQGKEIARVELEQGGLSSIVAPGVVRDGVFYVGTTHGIVAAIDASTGERIWTKEWKDFAKKVSKSPTLSGDGKTLLVAASKVLVALDAVEGGAVRWQSPAFPREIPISPFVVGDVVLVCQPGSSEVHRFDIAEDGAPMPKLTLPAAPTGPFHQIGNIAVYPDAAGKLNVLDLQRGEVVWSTPPLGKIVSVLPFGKMVWVSLDGGTVLVVRLQEEAWEAWRKKLGGRGNTTSALLVGETLYFGADGKFAVAMDARTGKMVWEISLPSAVTARPCLADDLIFFPCEGAKIYAVLR